MAPTTPFEDTAGSSLTSLAAEQAFLQTVATETDAALTAAATSVQDRPIWRLDLGNPAGSTWMCVTNQHCDEHIAREAALIFLRDLAYSTDQDVLDYLASHRIVFVPTANPDTTEQRSHVNSLGVDINRDVFELSQPESRALQQILNECGAVLVTDGHERSNRPAVNMEYRRQELAELYDGLAVLGDDLIADIAAAYDAESVAHQLFPAPGRNSWREAAALHHSVALLFESHSLSPRLDRVEWYRIGFEAVRAWHGAHATDLATAVAESRQHQATTDDAYVLEHGVQNFPWPTTVLPADLAGYRVSGVLPTGVVAYNVQVQGTVVPLSQPARAVVPILLDQESDDQQTPTTRLTELSAPAVVANVRDLVPIVSGSHRVIVTARVLTTFQTGHDPAGEDIPIISGDVEFDATADVLSTLELDTHGISEADLRSLFPRRAGDLLSPYGHEVFVRRGVDTGDQQLWVPLGIFRIDNAEQQPASDGPIRLSCSDRWAGIVDSQLLAPRQFRRGRTISSIVDELVGEVYPSAVVVFDDDSGAASIGRQMIVEKSRATALRDIADALSKIVYWDGEGVLRFETPPALDEIVWDISAGRDGVLVEAARRVSREGMANGVVATGEGSSAQPVRGVAVDRGPNSPTRWDPPDDPAQLWFGQVPTRFSSPILTSDEQAQQAAETVLRRKLGMPYSVDFGVVPNPALRPYHAVRVTQKDGNRETHEVETLSIPLTVAGRMTGTTKEKTHVSIGPPP